MGTRKNPPAEKNQDPPRQGHELDRRDQMRMDMMRSVVTEPLLSKVQANPKDKFEVIIALNELFEGGIEKALQYIKQRAEEWNVEYNWVSHYCFACLTGEQILALAE